MPNRGVLNWSGNNTTASVAAGYYSGGTLDSRPSYNNGYSAGKSAGAAAATIPTDANYTRRFYVEGRTGSLNQTVTAPVAGIVYIVSAFAIDDVEWYGGNLSTSCTIIVKVGGVERYRHTKSDSGEGKHYYAYSHNNGYAAVTKNAQVNVSIEYGTGDIQCFAMCWVGFCGLA